MPRLPINYANTQIYRFVCNDVNITNTYVGSTTNWTKRKANHKICCTKPNNRIHNLNVYQVIRANGGWDNWNMVLVENYPCNGKREAEQREQHWKEHYNDDMGLNMAFRTEDQTIQYYQQYRDTHKEQIAVRNKKYREINEDQVKNKKKQYREAHKEQIAEHDKQYKNANKVKILEQAKQYREINKEQINAKKREKAQLISLSQTSEE